MGKISVFFLLVLYIAVAAAGQICARYGAEFSAAYGSFNAFHALSYAFLVTRGPLWIMILKNTDLSTAYPVQGLLYPLILLISFLLFAESITAARIIASISISAGIMLVVMPGKKGN